MAHRYASHQPKASPLRASADLVLACASMTSLVGGLGLGAAGYFLDMAGIAASGAVVVAAGLYVERMQVRALRRRRRAERMRNRHEVTELRRTIAQLRLDVGAFQRALLDTEAALAAQSLPVTERSAEPIAEPLVAALDEPLHAWVQTPDRDAPADGDRAGFPARQPGPFVGPAGGSSPVRPELPPRRTLDTGGIPVLDPAPRNRRSATAGALVPAASAEPGEGQRTGPA